MEEGLEGLPVRMLDGRQRRPPRDEGAEYYGVDVFEPFQCLRVILLERIA
jgi:hypothetical protein